MPKSTIKPRTWLALSATTLLSMALAGGLPAAAQETTEITILHDTHFHGGFGYRENDDGTTTSDIAEYMALAESLKSGAENALFVGNGDDIAPSVHSGVFFGRHMVDALNASPLDFDTYGNHEFDYGPDNIADLVAASEFEWVSANVLDNRTDDVFGAEQGAQRFVVRDYGGVQVGITGLGPRDMASVTSMGENAFEVPAIEAMTEVVPMMRDAGADVIIVGSHLCGPDARELAAAVDGIDVIVGDHCSEELDQPEIINDTIVSFVGDEFDFLGELTLQVTDGDITGFTFTKHDVGAADMAPHPEVQAVVEDYQQQLDEELSEVIGERAVEWDTRRETVRTQEASFGNLVTDAMRELHDADFAFQNGGGIRGDQIYGANEPITRFEIVENLPFPNTVVLAEMPGSMLHDVLEHAVAGLPGAGQFLQVSGVEYTFDAEREVGDRIVSATIGCEPIDDDATYTFATNDFLLGGGDGFEMLTETETLVPGHEGPLMSGFMMDYVEEAGVITTDVEGRITRVGTDDEPLCEPTVGVEFQAARDEVPAGSATPVRFHLVGEDVAGDVTARVVQPNGDEVDAQVRRTGGDRYLTVVRTDRSQPGTYTLVVSLDGEDIGELELTAR